MRFPHFVAFYRYICWFPLTYMPLKELANSNAMRKTHVRELDVATRLQTNSCLEDILFFQPYGVEVISPKTEPEARNFHFYLYLRCFSIMTITDWVKVNKIEIRNFSFWAVPYYIMFSIENIVVPSFVTWYIAWFKATPYR